MEYKDDNIHSSFTSIYVEGSPLLITKQSNYMRIDSSASKLSSHSNDDGSSRNTTPHRLGLVTARSFRKINVGHIDEGILNSLKILYGDEYDTFYRPIQWVTVTLVDEGENKQQRRLVPILHDYPVLTLESPKWIALADKGKDILPSAMRGEPSLSSEQLDAFRELEAQISFPKGCKLCTSWINISADPTIQVYKDRIESTEPLLSLFDTVPSKNTVLQSSITSNQSLISSPSPQIVEGFPMGIKLSYLLKVFLHEDNLQVDGFKDKSVEGFFNDLKQQLPGLYSEYLTSNPPQCDSKDSKVVGAGEILIICDPQDNFFDIMTALKEYFDKKATPDIYVCMDRVTHPSPFTTNGTPNEVNKFETTFLNHIRSVIVVISPWDNIRILRRAKVLLELYCAIKTGCNIDIALSSQEKKRLVNRVRQCKSEADAVTAIQEAVNLDFGESKSLPRSFERHISNADEAKLSMIEIEEILRDCLIEQSKSTEGVPKGIKLSYLLSVFTDENKFADIVEFQYFSVGQFLNTCLERLMPVTGKITDCATPTKSQPPSPVITAPADGAIPNQSQSSSPVIPAPADGAIPNQSQSSSQATSISPLTFYSDYLELYPPNKEKVVDDAEVYITCELTNNFLETMKTLKDHFIDKPHTYICMDRVTHRTPSTGEGKGSKFLIEKFEERIKQIGHVVVVMSPWNNMGFLRRTALLFEIYCACMNDCKFDIALSMNDKKKLIECVKKGGEEAIQEALERIDIHASKSSFDDLESRVKDRVKSDTEVNQKIQKYVSDHLTVITGVTKGIKLSYLLKLFLHENHVHFEGFKDKSVEDFLRDLNKKIVEKQGTEILFSKYLEKHSHNAVGFAQVYIACEAKNKIKDTMIALKDHFRFSPDIYIAMDRVTHRTPYRGKSSDSVFLIDQFEERIKQVGSVLVVMSPWNNIGFFRRSAVLYEIYCAVKKENNCKFDIALSLHEKKKLVKAVKNGGVGEIHEALEWISFEKSKSSFRSMCELIKEATRPHDIANLTVVNAMRDCLTAKTNFKEKGALRGIKLSFILKELVRNNSYGIEDFQEKTISVFLDALNEKLTGRVNSNAFLVDFLGNKKGEKLVDDADVYVSCALTNNFVNTMIALEAHFLDEPDTYICMDKLTHRTPSTGEGAQAIFDIRQFEERIKQTGHVVLVMFDWNKSPFFERTAVLFEVYCAMKNGCQFDIALDTNGRKELRECRERGGREIQDSIEWINKIDFNNSTSKFENLELKVKSLLKADEQANFLIRSAVLDCWTGIISSSNRENSISIKAAISQELQDEQEEKVLQNMMDKVNILRESILTWAKKPNSIDASALNIAEPNLDDLYKKLCSLIFLTDDEVLKSHDESRYVQLLNEKDFSLLEQLQSQPNALEPDEQDIFKVYSDITKKFLGRRHPKALLFRDLYVYSLFVSIQRKYDSSDTNTLDDVKAAEAEDKLNELMMLWESKINTIEVYDSRTLTIAFKTPLPLSYYRCMYSSNRREKLLLLCLNNTDYGGVWRITWIGISRKTVQCVFTGVSESQQQHTSMEVDWEVGELFKHSDSYQKADLSQIKSIYLQQKIPPTVRNSESSSIGRAFFAPVPKIYCSCEDFSLLAVNLSTKSIQVDALFQFRLIEIGKDSTCDKYILDYLSRYGFEVDSSIDFPDEITSGSSKSAVEKVIIFEPNSKSFMYDYTIKLRKQSEYAAEMQLRYFPFDQQELSLEVGLNTMKQHIELVPEKGEQEDDSTTLKKSINDLRHLKEVKQEARFDDELLRDEYEIIFSDSPPKEPSFASRVFNAAILAAKKLLRLPQETEEMSLSVPPEGYKDQKGAKKPWAKLDEKKSHWKITFSVFAKRSYSFYIWSTILPLLVFCLLSFLTFGVANDCTELDVQTKLTITLTILLSAVAFKVSISSFLPQNPYFTMLDWFMWPLTYFIGLVAVENLAWPAAVCTNLNANLDQSNEVGVMYFLLCLLAAGVTAMILIIWWIQRNNAYLIDEFRNDIAKGQRRRSP